MKKTVVLHSVAANGGDELLNKVLKRGLKKISNTQVTAYTTNSHLSVPFLDGEVFMDGYLSGQKVYPKRFKRLMRKLDVGRVGLMRLYLENKCNNSKNLIEHIKNSDYVILCPGGFIHEYYGLVGILEMVERVKYENKPVYIVAQSLGPFNNNNHVAKNILEKVDKVILREEISKKNIRELDKQTYESCKVTTDVAFAYRRLFNYDPKSETHKRRVLLNFRKWNHGKKKANVVKKGVEISKRLFNKGYNLEFISTCQGVRGYTDDSKISKKIVKKAKKDNPSFNAKVHTQRYEPEKLLRVMDGAAFYVGMRLHGAISAILADVPAFNIGYEHKSEGVYRTVGLQEYTIEITAPMDKIIGRLAPFVEEDLSAQRKKFRKALRTAEEKAIETFELI
ncbi:polysaccharide pyruvyl transferase WcaK-like protein [Salinibacter ruber]|uniref:polysaccharide pyruvyl transferase family protein n=1 Tax=Salinibacter ruber TaxID=146919 RepID=UPI0021690247|nr:polysaccharide pyruvyl transferase family protein [Salinibacter ruber]MCS3940537.1 polysaccharide pyruvyl transferase WcaK-like protein [Salinibacter ruber]